MADKITKQELKQPDKLQIMFAEVTIFFTKHKKQFAITAGTVVLVILAAAGWFFYQQHEENNALTQYNKAVEEYMKNRAAGKDPASATKLFEDVARGYSGTRAAAFSSYRLGNIYLSLGNVDGAIKAYQGYLSDNSTDNDFRVLVHNGLGYCYEAKKDYKSALGYYEKAANSSAGRSFESINYENIARAYEYLNDPQKALEYYKKAAEKATEPSMKELLNRKISALG